MPLLNELKSKKTSYLVDMNIDKVKSGLNDKYIWQSGHLLIIKTYKNPKTLHSFFGESCNYDSNNDE